MNFIPDLRTACLSAGPGLASVLASPALAVTVGLCLWRPYRRVPTLITWAHLLLGSLLFSSTWIEAVVKPGSWLMVSWCSALVVVAYLTAGLRLLDDLMVTVPAVAAAVASIENNARRLAGYGPRNS